MPWLLTLVLLLLTVAPITAGPLEPRLAAMLDKHPYRDGIPFIATLVEQNETLSMSAEGGARHRRIMLKELRQLADRSQKGLKTLLHQQGVQELRTLWLVNSLAGKADAATLKALAEWPQIAKIYLDEGPSVPEVAPEDSDAPPWNLHAVQAPALWSLGYTGAGVVIATMDTGADINHPDLAARWRGGNNSWFDPYGEHATPFDASGHGTQVLGVLTGDASSDMPLGIAPGAQWISVKIFNDAGSSRTSAIIEGFQWLLDPDGIPASDDAPAVINCSWGLSTLFGQCDPLFQQVLQTVKSAGIAVTFSAGNSGPAAATSQSPANYLDSFSVGALTRFNELAPFSSRGPSACNGDIFPRLSAPGVNIHTTHPVAMGSYAVVSGTSFAAPHVAGIMALLLEAVPELPPAQLEQLLEETAVDLGPVGPDHGYGFGLVNGMAALAELRQWPRLRIDDGRGEKTALFFANRPPGDWQEQSLLLGNSGGGQLMISSINTGPPFDLVADECSGRPLPAGDSCKVTIRFSPRALGSFAGTLHLASNATALPAVRIPLHGTAYSPAVLLAPDDQARAGNTVTFRWRATQGIDGGITNERLLLDESPEFAYRLQVHGDPDEPLAHTGLLLLILLPFATRRPWLRYFLLVIFALLLACGSDNDNHERSLTVSGLKSGSTYYWKIVAEDGFGSAAESATRQFTTSPP